MGSEQVLSAAAGVAVVLLAALFAWLGVRAVRRRDAGLEAALVAAEARSAELAERLARLERRDRGEVPETEVLTGVVPDGASYSRVVGDGTPREPEVHVAQRIEGRLFADLVARETVVTAASWLHGVRRALAPEVRNRIRFEMRREVKRARRQRRADLKAALRELQARERAAMTDDNGDDWDAA